MQGSGIVRLDSSLPILSCWITSSIAAWCTVGIQQKVLYHQFIHKPHMAAHVLDMRTYWSSLIRRFKKFTPPMNNSLCSKQAYATTSLRSTQQAYATNNKPMQQTTSLCNKQQAYATNKPMQQQQVYAAHNKPMQHTSLCSKQQAYATNNKPMQHTTSLCSTQQAYAAHNKPMQNTTSWQHTMRLCRKQQAWEHITCLTPYN